jgi:hypothetical protein
MHASGTSPPHRAHFFQYLRATCSVREFRSLSTISERKGRLMADDQEVLTVKETCELLSTSPWPYASKM